MPGEHETPFYKLPYPDPNGLITNGAKDLEELAKTVDTVLAHSTLLWVAQAGSGTAKSGQLLQMTAPGTLSLPAPAVNAIVGVYCAGAGSPSTVSSVAGGGVIAWTGGSTSTITLTTNQFVLLQGNGTNWLLIAGAPKLETAYTALATLAEATNIEPSASRPSIVNFEVRITREIQGATFWVDGVNMGTAAVGTGPGAAGFVLPFHVELNAGGKVQWKREGSFPPGEGVKYSYKLLG